MSQLEKPISRTTEKSYKNIFGKEPRQEVYDLYTRIDEFQEELSQVEGGIDLGINPDRINWSEMPAEIAASFESEFRYKPRDITQFRITSESDVTPGRNSVTIKLYRNNEWWSFISVGSIFRGDYQTAEVSIKCKSNQPDEARKAMKKISDELWNTTGFTDEESQYFIRDKKKLQFAKSFLDYATRELKARTLSGNCK